MSEPKDFQRISAERIVELFSSGQQRILLADEVGLGKTIVARSVVEMMRDKSKNIGQPFKVIYVCSNQSIIQQNADKLGIDPKNIVPLAESRLSMQHKHFFKQLTKEESLIPITPSTSLRQTEGYGNAKERALIFSLIHEDFCDSQYEGLKKYLDVYAKDGHTYEFSAAQLENRNDVSNCPEYYAYMRRLLPSRKEYLDTIAMITQEIEKDKPDHKYINDLRAMFCEISMEMIQPNLVIMDEFQRYRDLMKGGKDTEENRLAQKLFNADSNPKILLISATPYKPMETMEEISNEGENPHFADFNHLMCFLMGDKYEAFKPYWEAYSRLLGSLSADNYEQLLASKLIVEKMLKQVMVRTERYTPNLATYIVKYILPSSDEVNEYCKFRKLIDEVRNESGNTRKPMLNIDYLKSSPYLLSFMQNYVEKTYIEKAYKNRKGPKKDKFKGLLLKAEDLTHGRKIKWRNERLQVLSDIAFGKNGKGMENLLWIPPSLPYYKTESIFDKLADASKILVFSKWGFVPRMISTLLSYEAVRLSHAYKNYNSNNNALEKYKELLLSPFPNISTWFKKTDACCDLHELKSSIKHKIENKLKEHNIEKRNTNGQGYKNILLITHLLNGSTVLTKKLHYDERTLNDIVNLIIAAPGICMYRCFGSDYGETYETCKTSGLFPFINAFVNMLGHEDGQAVIQRNTKSSTRYSKTLEYCVNGNLQAMFDEYVYVMGYSKNMSDKKKKQVWDKMQSAIINRTPIDIDTDNSFCISKAKKYSVQRWFACDYAKISNNDKEEQRKQSIQAAFNSPFRPFVLASTSVGQEGLDFHLYCRKILHWNLPGNPINLEQRSGRINRYEGLAIRRTIAHLFDGTLEWYDLFKKASKTWKLQYPKYNQMIPHWCIPKECLSQDKNHGIEFIENIFPLYTMSRDIKEYSNLRKQLDLYRLTMGQPDQEFIISLLNQLNLSDDKKEQLTFHFSPSKY